MLFVAAVLTVGMAWQLAGVAAAYGVGQSQSPAGGVPVSELNDTAGNQSVDEGIQGQAPGSDAGGLIGISIQAGQGIVQILKLALMLPIVLLELGVPSYWAVPLGVLGQIINYIGLAQFVSNRNLI